MKKTVLLIILLALFLRIYNYDTVPRPFETWDEIWYGWTGWTLINNGVPTGWTAYKGRNTIPIKLEEGETYLATPAIHHPPLFSIVTGITTTLGGAKDMFDVSFKHMRIPPILFGVLTVFLVYLLGSYFYDKRIGLISSLTYATIPTIVISNRLTLSENLLLPLFLGGILLTLKYIKTGKPVYRNLSGVIAGLAVLTKEPGLVVIFSMIIILAKRRLWRDIFIICLIALPLFFSYFVYGWIFDWEGFMITKQHYNKLPQGTLTAIKLVFEPKVVISFFKDGWILFGWFALIYASFKGAKHSVMPAIVYMLLLVVMVDKTRIWGWYYFPIYPFLSIGIGKYLSDMVEKRNVFLFALFIMIAGWWSVKLSLNLSQSFFPIFFSLLFIVSISLMKYKPNALKTYLVSIICLTIIFNTFIVLNFQEIYAAFQHGWWPDDSSVLRNVFLTIIE